MATSINGIGCEPGSLNVANGDSEESFVVIATPDELNQLPSNLTISCSSVIFPSMPQGSLTENVSIKPYVCDLKIIK